MTVNDSWCSYPGSSPQARGALKVDQIKDAVRRLIPAGAGSTTPRPRLAPRCTAHPRRRGEHADRTLNDEAEQGSSPQARGARGLFDPGKRVRGLIPAGAGSTCWLPPELCGTRAHPRRRGEHHGLRVTQLQHEGSSPQARGALDAVLRPVERGRLIPAGAGSTPLAGLKRSTTAAHPRRRGEHFLSSISQGGEAGSSPQARGARGLRTVWPALRGLIPAGAGSTQAVVSPVGASAAHPRRRGEHRFRDYPAGPPDGSSPQARGALRGHPVGGRVSGLIPAGAGSTRCGGVFSCPLTAHPRRRGEHPVAAIPSRSMSGSSPQARGAPRQRHEAGGGGRLIPAGAGSTGTRPPPHRGTAAHPRRRGEHRHLRRSPRTRTGSSPQARGAHYDNCPAMEVPRLIPAGAGSTWTSTGRRCGTPAHPRRRGEHIPHRALQRGEVRLIPAGAGSTSPIPFPLPVASAHPRRRGEHRNASSQDCTRTGSSPQARGARDHLRVQQRGLGLIPAGAGSTPLAETTPLCNTAHPRRRGEHAWAVQGCCVRRGSSPQARGAQDVEGGTTTGRGLIPAGAGSTSA